MEDKRVKLTPEQVAEMVALYASGNYTQNELALKFGVSTTRVNQIVRYHR